MGIVEKLSLEMGNRDMPDMCFRTLCAGSIVHTMIVESGYHVSSTIGIQS